MDRFISFSAALLWFAVGCDIPTRLTQDLDESGFYQENQGSEQPADVEELPPLLECEYPEHGYGTEIGEALEPFRLWDCDAGEHTLPSLWCGSEVTVIHISLAWCTICYDATLALRNEVAIRLQNEPVRVIEILVEGDHGVVAGTEVCSLWSDQFGSSLPVYIARKQEYEGPLRDLAESRPLPATIVLDRDGVIRYHSHLPLIEYAETRAEYLHDFVEGILYEQY